MYVLYKWCSGSMYTSVLRLEVPSVQCLEDRKDGLDCSEEHPDILSSLPCGWGIASGLATGTPRPCINNYYIYTTPNKTTTKGKPLPSQIPSVLSMHWLCEHTPSRQRAQSVENILFDFSCHSIFYYTDADLQGSVALLQCCLELEHSIIRLE